MAGTTITANETAVNTTINGMLADKLTAVKNEMTHTFFPSRNTKFGDFRNDMRCVGFTYDSANLDSSNSNNKFVLEYHFVSQAITLKDTKWTGSYTSVSISSYITAQPI